MNGFERDTGGSRFRLSRRRRPALGLEHSLCVFARPAGESRFLEHNGDFFPCDHFVDRERRLATFARDALGELLESQGANGLSARPSGTPAPLAAVTASAGMCNADCQYRFIRTPDRRNGSQLPLRGIEALLPARRAPLAEMVFPGAGAGRPGPRTRRARWAATTPALRSGLSTRSAARAGRGARPSGLLLGIACYGERFHRLDGVQVTSAGAIADGFQDICPENFPPCACRSWECQWREQPPVGQLRSKSIPCCPCL